MLSFSHSRILGWARGTSAGKYAVCQAVINAKNLPGRARLYLSTVRKGPSKRVTFQQSLKGSESEQSSGGRVFQAEGTGRANALNVNENLAHLQDGEEAQSTKAES